MWLKKWREKYYIKRILSSNNYVYFLIYFLSSQFLMILRNNWLFSFFFLWGLGYKFWLKFDWDSSIMGCLALLLIGIPRVFWVTWSNCQIHRYYFFSFLVCLRDFKLLLLQTRLFDIHDIFTRIGNPLSRFLLQEQN